MIAYLWINFYQDLKEHHVNLDQEVEAVEEEDLEVVVVDLEDLEVVDFQEEADSREVDLQEEEGEVSEVEIEEAKDLEEEDLNNDKETDFYSINIWLERTLFIFSLFKMLL